MIFVHDAQAGTIYYFSIYVKVKGPLTINIERAHDNSFIPFDDSSDNDASHESDNSKDGFAVDKWL